MTSSNPQRWAAWALALVVLAGCSCGETPPKIVQRPKNLGEKCARNSECASELCGEIPGTLSDGPRCLQPCGAGCQANERCVDLGVRNGTEQAYACALDQAKLCTPCSADNQCGYPGDACLRSGSVSACGRDCSGDEVCPDGFRCRPAAQRFDGTNAGKQCIPISNSCECSPATAGQTRQCSQSGDAGMCRGVETCDPALGWTVCTAPAPKPETCNGVDDNCNGTVDEGLGTITCGKGPCEVTVSACSDGGAAICRPDTTKSKPETCDLTDQDCDGVVDNGFDTTQDLRNCGACNNVCGGANAAPTCIAGQCGLNCNPGFANCNSQLPDGCEINTRTDPLHCGNCTNACSYPNAGALCADGGCAMGNCATGYVDLDRDAGNGCEYRCTVTSPTESCNQLDDNCDGRIDEGFNLDTDIDNCGRCNRACPRINATATCDQGQCELACTTGFGNCNTTVSDGCEVNLRTNVDNCGVCNRGCSFPNAASTCADGGCVMGACTTGYVDLDQDAGNGCEYRCTFVSAIDLPDLQGVDANCDGIDGEIGNGIFVSGAGNNANAGTRALPVKTIAKGLELAQTNNKRDVYVATGTYALSSSVDPIALKDGIGLYGGYEANNGWSRIFASGTTTLSGTSSKPTVISTDSVDDATVQNFLIQGGTPTGVSASAVAVKVTNSRGLLFEGVEIRAGDGSDGSDGTGGTDGADGNVGSPGTSGFEDDFSGVDISFPPFYSNICGECSRGAHPSCAAPSGGAGGTNSTCTSAFGGRGGASGWKDNSGSAGSASPGGAAGGQAVPAGRSNNDPGAQFNGSDGANGASASNGPNGAEAGGFSGGLYTPAHGGDGANGSPGKGGGGGGGGGGDSDGSCWGWGSAGGGGGAGGCGGTKGTGGKGGGASIALWVEGTTLEVRKCVIAPGTGGAGGNGGRGGSAGVGKGGGVSNYDTSNRGTASKGGRGGKGGDGSRGGHGGGGGGGPSIGVVQVGTVDLTDDGSTRFSRGTPGPGGLDGSGQNRAATGTATQIYP